MINNQQNTELNPTVSLLRVLDKLLDHNDRINAVLLYMPLHSAMVNILRLSKGSFRNTSISPNETTSYPDRKITNRERVVLRPVTEIQSSIYNQLSEKPDLFPSLDKTGNMVAVFRFLSAVDSKWDILYLLINDELKNKILAAYAPLIKAADSKPSAELIIKMYLNVTYPFFNEVVNSAKIKLEQLSKHNHYISKLLTYNEQLKFELNQLRQKKEGEILKEFEFIARKAENDYRKNFTISDDTKEFILNYKGNLNNLKKSFEKAIEDLLYLNTDQHIIIKPIHLELTDYNSASENNYQSKKQEKAAEFLQRYEDAAQAAYAEKQPVTINTIAKHIKPKPISPPAISHNLKKYRSEIISLLNSSATNWILLRNYFKPIKNMAEKFTN